MKYNSEDYNVLSYLLGKNTLSYEDVIRWAYSQFNSSGVDPFIEKISLASDVREIIELISNEYQVYGEPCGEFLLGEIADKYLNGQININSVIHSILYVSDIELEKEEERALYIADDYFGWHDKAEYEAKKLANPILNKYRPSYICLASKFQA